MKMLIVEQKHTDSF